jgi:hypothetical protein
MTSMRNLIALIIIVFTCISCQENSEINSDLINRIPTDAKIIVHIDNLEDLDQFFSSNELFQKLSELSRIKEIKEASSFLKNYNPNGESLIALSIEGKNEVVITLITSPLKKTIDSTSTTSVITYNDAKIIKNKINKRSYYSLNHKGVHLASSSLLVLESIVRRDVSDYVFDDGFQNIYNRTKSGSTFYIKATEKKWLEQFLLGNNISDSGNHAEWYQLEARTGGSYFQLDGVITYQDSLKMDHDLYNNLDAAENHIQEVVPLSFRSLKSVTYQKPSQLIDNLKRYHSNEVKVGSQLMAILDNTQEMSEVRLEKTNALVFTLKPYEAVFMNLDSLSVAKFTYRDHLIYELANPIKTHAIRPLVQAKEYKFVTVLDQHLICSNSASAPEEFISNYQNKTVLSEQPWWNDAREALSNSSSLLKITSVKEVKELAKNSDQEDLKVINKLDENDFPLIISQYVHEDEYAHYHLVVPYAMGRSTKMQVSQIGSYKSPKKIIAGPFLFPNHLNKRHDVAFQDEDFTLHMISEFGKKRWSKNLDGPILGEIEVTDAYKNGRQQMAFATNKSVYFIDRNAKDVNAYPKRFKDAITQPLSVFDYDNRREYRFLVTQGDELIMLDREGKTVSGFTYKKGKDITSQPQHFRVGIKDYIAFAKADNSIALLSRTGSMRTNVKEKPKLKTALYLNKNKALALTEDGRLMQLDPVKGTVNYKETYRSDAALKANSKMVLIQNNNELSINSYEVKLPYGTYLPAEVTRLSSGDFIHLIETGENKVYVLDRKGDILSSLPVYGKTKSAIAQSKNRYLATLDGDDVIIYKW